MRPEPDKILIKKRFSDSFGGYDKLAVTQSEVCGRLVSHLTGLNVPPPARALEIGAGTGFLTRGLLGTYTAARWYINDLSDAVRPFIDRYVTGTNVEYIWGDAEKTELPAGLDLIAGASVMQWFEDPEGMVRRLNGLLNPGGTLAVSTFGPDNYREVAASGGEGLSYLSVGELVSVMERSGFESLHCEEYRVVRTFTTPAEVLTHIRDTGVNGIRPVVWTPSRLRRFMESYSAMFSDAEGNVPLTYHPIIYIGRKPF